MWLGVAGLLGASAVAAGAFGAHALRGAVSDAGAASWNTASEYHLLHAIAVLALALHARATATVARVPLALFTIGALLFAGSIYLLVLFGWRWLGPLTPLGGLLLIAGWLSLLLVGRPVQAR